MTAKQNFEWIGFKQIRSDDKIITYQRDYKDGVQEIRFFLDDKTFDALYVSNDFEDYDTVPVNILTYEAIAKQMRELRWIPMP